MSALSSAELSFRLATPADAPCLSALATQVFLDTYAIEGISPWFGREVQAHCSPQALNTLLAKPNSTFIIAQRSAHLIAFAQLSEGAFHSLVASECSTELERLYVQAPFVGKGIGKVILQRAEALAASRGASTLWLTAWVGNGRALSFYAREGYKDHGRAMSRSLLNR